ncbi:MAG TPA: energy-coupling factor transporter transmembrane component T [Bryobacteraceae bacterium]|nr:energy-coupling factor transporter transmembrane component T [Bryobacteraceae bacterium]
MHHVVLEQWSRGRSVVHDLDARAKSLVLLVFLVVITTTPPDAALQMLTYFGLLLVGLAAACLPIPSVLARATVVLPFSATFAAVSWLAGDRMRALGLVEKTYLSAIAVLLVAGTTPLPALLNGFEALGVPRVLTSVVQFLYRYLFVISEQAQHMRVAAASRAGLRKSTRKSRFQLAAGALGVLFARSYMRADGIHRAMQSRGFRGRLPMGHPPHFRVADAAFAVAAIALVVGIRALPWTS